MKYTKLLISILVLGFAALTVSAFAQADAVPATTEVGFQMPPEVDNIVLAVFTKLVVKYPWLATVIAFIGAARLWAKPLSSMVHHFVELSPTKRDDDWLKAFISFFHENAVGRVLAYLLDWFTSIKLQVPNYPEIK